MKKLLLILISILFTVSCSVKLPEVATDDKGILVMPAEIINQTNSSFAYKYQLLYVDENNKQSSLGISPAKNKKYYLFEDIPVGDYTIVAIKTYSSQPTAISAGSTNKIDAIFFSSKGKTITILDKKIQVIKKTTGTSRFTQYRYIIPATAEDKEKTKAEIKKLENANQWTIE